MAHTCREALWYASRSFFFLALPAVLLCATRNRPDIKTIVDRSVAANDKDFAAGSDFNYKEKDRDSNGTKTLQVTMIDGTPYQRLLAVNGKPLSKEQAADEWKKQEQASAERRAQTPEQRNKRIADYAERPKARPRDDVAVVRKGSFSNSSARAKSRSAAFGFYRPVLNLATSRLTWTAKCSSACAERCGSISRPTNG